MASLTTVYVISIILTSLAGIGSAFVGNKIYPLKGGSVVEVETPKEVTPPAPAPAIQVADTNPLQEAIKSGFNMDDEFAANVVDFIKTPVIEWTSIAGSPQELRRKFMKALTHPNLNKCPAKLLDLCKIVNIKYSNMKDFIENNPYIPYEDQTKDALDLLSSTE